MLSLYTKVSPSKGAKFVTVTFFNSTEALGKFLSKLKFASENSTFAFTLLLIVSFTKATNLS